jgi:hypothetical protein
MSDTRATHLWDEKRLASWALAGEVEGAVEPVWDAYLLYGPESAWGDGPLGQSVRGTRSTTLGQRLRRTSYRSWSEG